MNDMLIIKGNILYMTSLDTLEIMENGYLLCEKGICKGVYKELPFEYQKKKITDYRDCLIIPGMTDLHVHAPQYSYRGLGMDKELLEWLNENAFPEETKYQDLDYAREAYQIFVDDLRKSATTRACIFATKHKDATLLLMKELEQTGLITLVGKVNMDRNSSKELQEKCAEESLTDTEWLINQANNFKRTKPIITPRFVPTCSDELMEGLGHLRKKYNLPVQSHLSENISEIEWVKKLNPKAEFYGDAYDMFGLFGKESKTVMAHCVYSEQKEIDRMRENQVMVAHCPCSNTCIASGIAPIRAYLSEGVQVGLGTDIAGGYSISMFHAIVDTINASKLYWRLIDQTKKPITSKEAFYLATMGGGQFFGKVGSFLPGYEADILVLDDSKLRSTYACSLTERLERIFYLAKEETIVAKYVHGDIIFDYTTGKTEE